MTSDTASLAKALREHAAWLHNTYDFGYMDAQIKVCNVAADALSSPIQMDEAGLREILAQECEKQGFGYASVAMKTPDDVTQWTSVALAAMRRLLTVD